MEYDREKVDEMVLALLALTMFPEGPGVRAWKCHDWDAMERLHERGYISDPKSKAKSVVMTEEGGRRARLGQISSLQPDSLSEATATAK
jgi:hypothetical protein